MMSACVYLAVFFAAGMITGVVSAVFDRGFFVSCGAMIKFLITSYVNSAYHRIFAAGFKNFCWGKKAQQGH